MGVSRGMIWEQNFVIFFFLDRYRYDLVVYSIPIEILYIVGLFSCSHSFSCCEEEKKRREEMVPQNISWTFFFLLNETDVKVQEMLVLSPLPRELTQREYKSVD
eukprot:TRINITY_DN3032_c0_g1_i1.p1 TRINITY_DN3032_c0_g1~~TRINITY_DN3032_c0_g1_i1.p1  ORF type:complete len:104 (+),score=19.59 TRINITY_DN3032_c0_g1_i1:79-390(+)